MNYCLDDVEEFVTALKATDTDPDETQFWTMKTKMSSHHQQVQNHNFFSLPCHSKKNLEMLPSVNEFVDVIRKLKLAIVLLSRLDGRLYDPPADEVLHGLFGQLRIITRYSYSIASHHSNFSLPATVVAPLLSRRAIEFLNQNLSPSETQFWVALGEAWTTPRDQWTRPVEPFVPSFANKKQPNPAWIEQL